jgi:Na+/proline symporter
VTLVFTLLVTLYAVHSDASIFKMVENAYQITLVSAFIPLVCGIYWSRSTNQGGLVSIFMGVSVWISVHLFGPEDPLVPAQLAGLIASAIGMVAGSLLPQVIAPPVREEPAHAALHHQAAAQTHHAANPPHHRSAPPREV